MGRRVKKRFKSFILLISISALVAIIGIALGCKNPLLETAKEISENPVPSPEINIKHGRTDILCYEICSFGFSPVGLPYSATFIIENLGKADLQLNGNPNVQISGTYEADFSVTAMPSSPITPGGSTSFAVTFTPGNEGEKTISISIPNNDEDENPYEFIITGRGTIVPIVTISSDLSSPTNTSPIPVKIEFSEEVSGFEAGDIIVGNGSVIDLQTTNNTLFLAIVTPSGDGDVTVDVPAGAAKSAVTDRDNEAALQYSIEYDGTSPSVVISSVESPTYTSPIPVTITFNEAVTGFDLGDISVTNGTPGNLNTVDNTVFTFEVVPSEQQVTVIVNVAADVAQDAAGNLNTTATPTPFSIVYDGTLLTVVVSSSLSSPTYTSPIPITITFSEEVTGFIVDDIVVGNGTASNLQTSDNTVFTADITPSGYGTVTVDIPAGAAQSKKDTEKNNQAAPPFSIDYVPKTVTVTSPNGGQLWRIGSTQTISWNSVGIANVRVELFRNGEWEYIDVGGAIYNTGSMIWTVTHPTATDAKIRVSDADGGGSTYDESDATFEIVERVWYVDALAPAGGDGRGWYTAFQFVKDGVAAATAGDEVWVKAGTHYRKGSDTTLLGLKAGVDVYGGFAGTESLRSQRDWVTNATVLNGQGVVYNVIVGANDSRLDGFTITGGTDTNRDGGGLYSGATGLEIANCTFSTNRSDDGGAVFLSGGSATFTQCTFNANEAERNGRGGAIWVLSASATFKECVFTGNVAHGDTKDGRGGAINVENSTVVVEDCQFENNSAESYSGIGLGGAMYNNDSTVVVRNSRFKNNWARDSGFGGAIYNHMSSTSISVDITNCVFISNVARVKGGAIANGDADFNSGPVTIVNSSFSSNEAQNGPGGGVCNFDGSEVTITNSIFYQNYGAGVLDQIYNADTSVSDVTYSNVEGGYDPPGTGNIDDYVGFIDQYNDLHLNSSSSCIDAANGAAAPPTDKDGNGRNDDPDMGAYEYWP